MVAGDIVEFDSITIKVVQDSSAILVTHTVVRLGASVTVKYNEKIHLCQMNIVPLFSKPYVNEVTLREQK